MKTLRFDGRRQLDFWPELKSPAMAFYAGAAAATDSAHSCSGAVGAQIREYQKGAVRSAWSRVELELNDSQRRAQK